MYFPIFQRFCLWFCLLAGLSACGVLDRRVLGSSIPANSSFIADKTINISPGYSTTLEKISVAALAGTVLYYVYLPLDPNWEVSDTQLREDTFRVSLRMKRFYTGGEGETMQVLKAHAEGLQGAHGARAYQLLSFTQGIESSTPIARRVAQATIRLQDMYALNPPEQDGPPWPLPRELDDPSSAHVAMSLSGRADGGNSNPTALSVSSQHHLSTVSTGSALPTSSALRSVYFAVNKAEIGESDKNRLADQGRLLAGRESVKPLILGSADERGSAQHNLKLGKKRADAVKEVLVEQGVEREKIRTISLGESQPQKLGKNEAAWAENRRADLIVENK